MPEVGSMIWIDTLSLNGLLPAQNYQTSWTYDQIQKRLDSETYRTQFAQSLAGNGHSQTVSCYRCPLQSTKLCTLDQGKRKGKQVRGPEFQSAWALGANCGVLDFRPIIASYAACNDYGIDAISLGGAIGFAMECCQRGLLDKDRVFRDYDGLRLEWGDCEAVLRMVEIVALRRGWLGD